MVRSVLLVRALFDLPPLPILLLPSNQVRFARALLLFWSGRAACGEGGKSKCEHNPVTASDQTHSPLTLSAAAYDGASQRSAGHVPIGDGVEPLGWPRVH